MPDFSYAHEECEISLARRRADVLEAFLLLMKQNRDDPVFWHLTFDQRRRICERFDEEVLERMLQRLWRQNDE